MIRYVLHFLHKHAMQQYQQPNMLGHWGSCLLCKVVTEVFDRENKAGSLSLETPLLAIGIKDTMSEKILRSSL